MSANNQHDFAVTLPDYERIYQAIHGVLLNEKADLLRACLYFGIIGAAILRTHHKIDAKPVVGIAAYRLEPSSNDVLTFAASDTDGIHSTEDGFHCWVEANGFAIDFQAPLFKEVIAQRNPSIVIPRRMLQKQIDLANPSLESLAASGTHWYEQYHVLGQELFSHFFSKPANTDLTEICNQWYKPSPKKKPQSIQIGDQHGHTRPVPLSPLRVSGAW